MVKHIGKQLIVGGIVGFFGAFFTLMLINDIQMDRMMIYYSLASLILLLIIASIVLLWQIVKHMKREVKGEAEDELDRLLYVKSADSGMVLNTAIVFGIILVCLTIMESLHLLYLIGALVLMGIAIGLQYYQSALYKEIYPERNLPHMNDPDYAEKLVNIADEGERFVMLHGMMKAYNMYTLLLVLAIVLSTIYSLFSAEQQIFSIVLMGIILIVSNGVYFITIRKKA